MNVNASLITTKERPSYHGIGLQVVKSIADMYEGMTDYYMEEGLVFVASVMLESND
jgi:two-component sensor histidine kinase